MRIIIIHSFYQLAGGEDKVFEQEAALLMNDNDVMKLSFQNNSGIKGFLQFLYSIWNISAAQKLRHLIETFKPDIIHIHNYHFGSGPIIIRTAKKKSIPVVLTLHNYRLICPSATLYYNNQLFNDSIKATFPWKAIKLKVYRNSLFLTFYTAFITWFHKKINTWKMVDKYVVLTEFAKELFISSSLGVKANKYIVKPNFVKQLKATTNGQKKDFFLFIGRLSEEKGIKLMLNTFKISPFKLVVVGEGPLKEFVENVSSENKNIIYEGKKNHQQIVDLLQQSSALIFPSIWYEGMPMTILEAFSTDTIVIASNIGAMSSMIRSDLNGFLFNPNSIDLLNSVMKWENLPAEAKTAMYRSVNEEYKQKYTPDINIRLLIFVYRSLKTSS